jgi:hypothetical protein
MKLLPLRPLQAQVQQQQMPYVRSLASSQWQGGQRQQRLYADHTTVEPAEQKLHLLELLLVQTQSCGEPLYKASLISSCGASASQ